jgi:hypothetical protein
MDLIIYQILAARDKKLMQNMRRIGKSRMSFSCFLILISLNSSGVIAMELPQSPPKYPDGEQIISSTQIEFKSCHQAFDEVVGNDISVLSRVYSKTERWGYVMRVIFHSIAEDGGKLPATSFICWKRPGASENVSISPLE